MKEYQENSRPPKTASVWRAVVMTILGLTALFKFIAILDPSNLLAQTDQIFKVPILYVVAGACLVECFLCVYVWLTANTVRVAWAVFTFAVAILTYRSYALANGLTYCPCLGNVTDWWPWLGRHEGPILTSVAIWLFLTSAMQLMMPERKAA